MSNKGKVQKENVDNEFDFDDDLGMDEFDLSFEEPVDDRSPALKATTAGLEGVLTGAFDAQFLEEKARDILPEGIGQSVDYADRMGDKLSKTYDDSVKAAKPAIKDFKKTILKVMPPDSEYVPGFFKETLEEWKRDTDPKKSAEQGIAEMREEMLGNQIGAIFSAQLQQADQMHQHSQAKESIDDAIAQDRHQENIKMSSRHGQALDRIDQYMRSINLQYQKKDLELQYRQLFALQDILKVTQTSSQVTMDNLPLITKNTALPDFVKQTSKEFLAEYQKNKFIDAIGNGLFGSSSEYLEKGLNRLSKNIVTLVGRKAREAQGLMSQLGGMLDMNAQMSGMGGLSTAEMAAQGIGGIAGSSAAEYGWDYLEENGKVKDWKDKVRESDHWAARGIRNVADYGSRFILNAPRYAADKQRQWAEENDGTIFGNVKQFVGQSFGQDATRQDIGVKQANQLIAPHDITHRTINEIIPGYMSRMLQELVYIRKIDEKVAKKDGVRVNTDLRDDRLVYDHDRADFVSRSDLKKDITKKFATDSDISSFKDKLEEMLELMNAKHLDADVQRTLIQGVVQASTEKKQANKKNLTDDKLFKGPNARKAKSFMESFMETVEQDHGLRKQFETKYDVIFNSLKNPRQAAALHASLGQQSEMKELGFLNEQNQVDSNLILQHYYGNMSNHDVVSKEEQKRRTKARIDAEKKRIQEAREAKKRAKQRIDTTGLETSTESGSRVIPPTPPTPPAPPTAFAKGGLLKGIGDLSNKIYNGSKQFLFNRNGQIEQGVLGEAGREAVLPASGGVQAVDSQGNKAGKLPLARDKDGVLSVKVDEQESKFSLEDFRFTEPQVRKITELVEKIDKQHAVWEENANTDKGVNVDNIVKALRKFSLTSQDSKDLEGVSTEFNSPNIDQGYLLDAYKEFDKFNQIKRALKAEKNKDYDSYAKEMEDRVRSDFRKRLDANKKENGFLGAEGYLKALIEAFSESVHEFGVTTTNSYKRVASEKEQRKAASEMGPHKPKSVLEKGREFIEEVKSGGVSGVLNKAKEITSSVVNKENGDKVKGVLNDARQKAAQLAGVDGVESAGELYQRALMRMSPETARDIDDAMKSLKEAGFEIGEYSKEALEEIYPGFGEAIHVQQQRLKAQVQSLREKAGDIISDPSKLINQATGAISDIAEDPKAALRNAANKAKEMASDAANKAGEKAQQAILKIAGEEDGQELIDDVKQLGQDIKQTGEKAVDYVKEKAAPIVEKVTDSKAYQSTKQFVSDTGDKITGMDWSGSERAGQKKQREFDRINSVGITNEIFKKSFISRVGELTSQYADVMSPKDSARFADFSLTKYNEYVGKFGEPSTAEEQEHFEKEVYGSYKDYLERVEDSYQGVGGFGKRVWNKLTQFFSALGSNLSNMFGGTFDSLFESYDKQAEDKFRQDFQSLLSEFDKKYKFDVHEVALFTQFNDEAAKDYFKTFGHPKNNEDRAKMHRFVLEETRKFLTDVVNRRKPIIEKKQNTGEKISAAPPVQKQSWLSRLNPFKKKNNGEKVEVPTQQAIDDDTAKMLQMQQEPEEVTPVKQTEPDFSTYGNHAAQDDAIAKMVEAERIKNLPKNQKFAKGGLFGGLSNLRNRFFNKEKLFSYVDQGLTKIGLLGEAGQEAVIPAKDGKVQAVSEDGAKAGTLSLTTDNQGVLSVEVNPETNPLFMKDDAYSVKKEEENEDGEKVTSRDWSGQRKSQFNARENLRKINAVNIKGEVFRKSFLTRVGEMTQQYASTLSPSEASKFADYSLATYDAYIKEHGEPSTKEELEKFEANIYPKYKEWLETNDDSYRGVGGFFKKIWNNLISFFASSMGNLGDAFQDGASGIGKFVDDSLYSMLEMGEELDKQAVIKVQYLIAKTGPWSEEQKKLIIEFVNTSSKVYNDEKGDKPKSKEEFETKEKHILSITEEFLKKLRQENPLQKDQGAKASLKGFVKDSISKIPYVGRLGNFLFDKADEKLQQLRQEQNGEKAAEFVGPPKPIDPVEEANAELERIEKNNQPKKKSVKTRVKEKIEQGKKAIDDVRNNVTAKLQTNTKTDQDRYRDLVAQKWGDKPVTSKTDVSLYEQAKTKIIENTFVTKLSSLIDRYKAHINKEDPVKVNKTIQKFTDQYIKQKGEPSTPEQAKKMEESVLGKISGYLENLKKKSSTDGGKLKEVWSKASDNVQDWTSLAFNKVSGVIESLPKLTSSNAQEPEKAGVTQQEIEEDTRKMLAMQAGEVTSESLFSKFTESLKSTVSSASDKITSLMRRDKEKQGHTNDDKAQAQDNQTQTSSPIDGKKSNGILEQIKEVLLDIDETLLGMSEDQQSKWYKPGSWKSTRKAKERGARALRATKEAGSKAIEKTKAFGGGVAGAAGSLVAGGVNLGIGATKGVFNAAGWVAKKNFEGIGWGVKKTVNWITEPLDVYVEGEKTPRLLGKLFEDKKHYFKHPSGKPVKDHTDINSAVVDDKGKFLIAKDEIGKLYTKGIAGRMKRLSKGLLSGALKLAGGVLDGMMGTARLVPWMAKGMWNIASGALKGVKGIYDALGDGPADVYTPGFKDPVLYKSVMKVGGYISKHSGKPIMRPTDIDGPVMDLEKNEVLSLDQLRKGVFDVNGNKFKTATGKLLGAVGAVTSGIFKAQALAWKATKGLAKGLFKGITGVAKWGLSGFSLEINGAKSRAVLEEIRDMLKAKFAGDKKLFGDADGDGDRDNSAKDIMERNKKKDEDKKKTIAERSKEKLNSAKDKLREKASNAKESMLETVGSLGAAVSGLVDGVKSLKTVGQGISSLFKFGGKAGMLARGASMVAGAGSMLGIGGTATAATGAIGAAGTAAATGAAATGATAMGTLGTTGAAIGGVISLPAVMTALGVAAVGYGAYKAYKYLTSAKLNTIENMRLVHYGYEYGDDDNYQKIFNLEDIYFKALSGDSINDEKLDTKEIFKLFDIGEGWFKFKGTKQEEMRKFIYWLQNRFKPVFLAHMQASKIATGKTGKAAISAIFDLKGNDAGVYLDALKINDNIFGVDIVGGKTQGRDAAEQAEEKIRKEMKLPERGQSKKKEGLSNTTDSSGKTNDTGEKASTKEKEESSGGLSTGKVLTGIAAIGAVVTGTVSLPFVAGVLGVAAVGYGAYSAFQYITKPKAATLDAIRLAQYGYHWDLDDYQKIINLEKIYLKAYNGETIDDKKVNLEMICDLFGVGSGWFKFKGTKQEEMRKLIHWLQNRFKPVFLAHLKAVNVANGKTGERALESIASLKADQAAVYLDQLKIDEKIFSVDLGESKKAVRLEDYEKLELSIRTLAKLPRKGQSGQKKKTDQLPGDGAKAAEPANVNASVAEQNTSVKNNDPGDQSKFHQFRQSEIKRVEEEKNKNQPSLWDYAKKAGLLAIGIGVLGLPAVATIGAAYLAYEYGGDAIGAIKDWVMLPSIGNIDKLRMVQYGFAVNASNMHRKIQKLEALLKECVKKKGSGFDLDDKKINVEYIQKLFEIDPGNHPQMNLFYNWYQKRFKPVFVKNIAVAQVVANKRDFIEALGQLKDLKPQEKLQYLKHAAFEDGPYTVPTFVTDGSAHVGAAEVKAVIAFIKREDKLEGIKEKELTDSKGKNITIDSQFNGQGNTSESKVDLNKVGTGTVVGMQGGDKATSSDATLWVKSVVDERLVKQGDADEYLDETVLEELIDLANLKQESNLTALKAVYYRALGLKELDQAKIKAITSLEKVIIEKITCSDGKAIWSGSANDAMAKTRGEFGIVDITTKEGKDWLDWFMNRFMPVYLKFTSLYCAYTGEKKWTGEVSALKVVHQLDLAKQIASMDSWKISASPWPGYFINTDASSVKPNLVFLEETAKKEIAAEEKAAEKKANTQQAKSQAEGNKIKPEDQKDKKQHEQNKNDKVEKSSEGTEAKPNAVSTPMDGAKVSATGLKMASGDRLDGSGGSASVALSGKNINLDGVNPALATLLYGMADEYKQLTGKKLPITDGFRSYEDQVAAKKKHGARAAEPGTSMHEFGLAIDADSTSLDKAEDMGLMRKYGLTRPIGQEPWHVEAIGTQFDLDKYKRSKNQAIDAILAGAGKGGGGYGTVSGAKKYVRNYEMSKSIYQADVQPNIENAGIRKDTEKLDQQSSKAKPAIEDKNEKKSIDNTTKPNEVAKPSGEKPNTDGYMGKLKTVELSPSGDSPKPTNIASAQDNAKTGAKADEQTKLSASVGVTPAVLESQKKLAKVPEPTGDRKSVIETVEGAAKTVGVKPDIANTTVAIESGFNPQAKANTSSASGLYQFIKSTWDAMLQKYGKPYGYFPGSTSPFDPKANAIMGAHYIKENEQTLKRTGADSDVDSTDIYMAHFMGPGGASKFLKALKDNPHQQADAVLPSAASANKSIFYDMKRPRNVAEVRRLLEQKVKTKASQFGVNVAQSSDSSASNIPTPINKPSPSAQEPIAQSVAQAKEVSTPVAEQTKPDTRESLLARMKMSASEMAAGMAAIGVKSAAKSAEITPMETGSSLAQPYDDKTDIPEILRQPTAQKQVPDVSRLDPAEMMKVQQRNDRSMRQDNAIDGAHMKKTESILSDHLSVTKQMFEVLKSIDKAVNSIEQVSQTKEKDSSSPEPTGKSIPDAVKNQKEFTGQRPTYRDMPKWDIPTSRNI